ncbi:hypothetical protein DUI87_27589 [Hirundo rustica rustica]|uniref:Uncharacterized protein n=1 Tax=Hirundo rustica rustica TaxID=333673 RepID=A0A3M0JAV1_HIRRU|nr:hypothetical protein DUI87_27589 [Hirundo rustica rustica]
MAQWGVTIGIPDAPRFFRLLPLKSALPRNSIGKLIHQSGEQWPLSKEKLEALQELVDEQLAKGHIVETTSPWNSPVFVIKKANKGKWRLLHDLHQINNVIEDMGSLQPGMPSPAMLPQNWNLAIIDIKDCFFQIPLHPDDAPRFTFSVPTLNRKAPRKRYHRKFLPQGMKNSPSICQWYLSSLLSPVHAAVGEAIILHYRDDVLVCAPSDDLLSHVLDLTINSLVAAGFELQEEKILRMPPWKYLGLETGKQTIVLQKLVVKNNIKTLADVQQLCGSLNWVRPWLGLTTEDLDPLFNLLKGGEELSSPRTLTQEARAALEKVQDCMATRQTNRCKSDLPFKFIILGKLPHLDGMIFQWGRVEKSKKDKDFRDPLLIIEWLFLIHHQSKRMTRPQELVAELIRKARTQITELAGCDFECIHIPFEINLGQITKAMLEHLIHENEALQFALDRYTDLAYVAGVVSRAEQAVLSEVSNSALFNLLSKLVNLISHREQQFYGMHIRSHTDLPGFIAEGNRRADALAAPVEMAPLPDIFGQAKISHQLFHQNAPGLVRQFHLTREQAQAIVSMCPLCQQHALPALSAGANPRGLNSCEVWQTDATHIMSFGRQRYVHVSVDNFSGAVYASAHTGEKSSDAMKHLIQAFSLLGIPKSIKTDNGLTYTSKEFRSFLQQWGVEHKTGIPYSPTGQATVERIHQNLKRVLNQQHPSLKLETSQIQLFRALFTLNFLNCTFENLNPAIVRHFRENCQLQLKAKPPIELDKKFGLNDLVLIPEADNNLLGRDLIIALGIKITPCEGKLKIYSLTEEDNFEISNTVWYTGEVGKLNIQPISVEIQNPEIPIRVNNIR